MWVQQKEDSELTRRPACEGLPPMHCLQIFKSSRRCAPSSRNSVVPVSRRPGLPWARYGRRKTCFILNFRKTHASTHLNPIRQEKQGFDPRLPGDAGFLNRVSISWGIPKTQRKGERKREEKYPDARALQDLRQPPPSRSSTTSRSSKLHPYHHARSFQ